MKRLNTLKSRMQELNQEEAALDEQIRIMKMNKMMISEDEENEK